MVCLWLLKTGRAISSLFLAAWSRDSRQPVVASLHDIVMPARFLLLHLSPSSVSSAWSFTAACKPSNQGHLQYVWDKAGISAKGKEKMPHPLTNPNRAELPLTLPRLACDGALHCPLSCSVVWHHHHCPPASPPFSDDP